jgi:radical SAM-linked protein
MNKNIKPEIDLKDALLLVNQPARYIGGEYQLKKVDSSNSDYRIGLCFPDLYEIGMSNNAMRILYDLINCIDGISCERVFAPAPDFEELLKERRIPLYTLESGLPLESLDMLCFTVGYELSATNILNVLELGNIPLHSKDRTNDHPVVIAGGPAITNPLPFSNFFDAVYLGEAESDFPDLLVSVKEFARENKKRIDIIKHIHTYDCIWHKGKKKTTRSIFRTFPDKQHAGFTYYTVPTLKPVQDHGVVEIMRGCPNGCRFCHAGELYKPYRQRSFTEIQTMANQMVSDFGYRDITLSSLSSGDHPDILGITSKLNDEYKNKHVSLSLPSLKVDGFSLSILDQLSIVRKSGLTFAIETPVSSWQKSMNKEAPIENIIHIIHEAKKRGWKLAKFYFMTGLPFVDKNQEIKEVTNFISRVKNETRIQLNINIGTFIPKPHTPFQWASLFKPDEALVHLQKMKLSLLSANRNIKVNYHDPYISFIEGMISRGDERVGDVILEAYRKGARLDAWDEYLNKELWLEIIQSNDWDILNEICRERDLHEKLPWDSIKLASSKSYLRTEYEKASKTEKTDICTLDCDHQCSVCSTSKDIKPIDAVQTEITSSSENNKNNSVDYLPMDKIKFLIQYQKTGKSIYFSHIHVMQMFEKTFQRTGIKLSFSQGYNPKPILEFAQPLPLGISGSHEVLSATLDFPAGIDPDNNKLIAMLNEKLPEGFIVDKMVRITNNIKKSLSASYYASEYEIMQLDDKGFALLHTLTEENKNISILEKNNQSVKLLIHEPDTKKTGKGMNSGNLMKLIGTFIPKYEFLSTYNVKRNCLYVQNMKDYISFYAI